MNQQTAADTILRHAGFIEQGGKPGLLASLRPYSGIDEVHFVELMSALAVLHGELQEPKIDRRLICATWWITSEIRIQALTPTGALLRDAKISNSDMNRLSSWAAIIERFTLQCTFGLELQMCMFPLLEYIVSDRCVAPVNFVAMLRYVRQCAEYEDPDVSETAIRAITAINEVR